jgi:hypothetical protein
MPAWFPFVQFIVALALICWASPKCTALDVKTGRRSASALIDDYGSNRGSYWPWSHINGIAFWLALAAPFELILLVK